MAKKDRLVKLVELKRQLTQSQRLDRKVKNCLEVLDWLKTVFEGRKDRKAIVAAATLAGEHIEFLFDETDSVRSAKAAIAKLGAVGSFKELQV
jgi:hypothetical protein